MCYNPIYIYNPNFKGAKHSLGINFHSHLVDDSFMIPVSCGHCGQCVAVKQMNYVQRCQMESLKNRMFFCTLTYKNDMLPKITTSSGFDIPFADQNHIESLVNRMRDSGLFPGIRHFCVSEFGSRNGRPHFHLIFMIPKVFLPDYASCINMESVMYDFVFNNWSVNVGSRRKPYFVPLFEYHEKWFNHKLYKNYDLHYINPSLTESGVSDVAWYVLKYMLKQSSREIRLQQALRLNLSEDEYNYIWNIVRPKLLKCHSFGLNGDTNSRIQVPDWDIVDYLRSCIVRSPKDSEFPYYFVPDTGLSMPLSRFYSSKGWIYPSHLAERFLLNRSQYIDSKTSQECKDSLDKFKRVLFITEDSGSDSYFSNL